MLSLEQLIDDAKKAEDELNKSKLLMEGGLVTAVHRLEGMLAYITHNIDEMVAEQNLKDEEERKSFFPNYAVEADQYIMRGW